MVAFFTYPAETFGSSCRRCSSRCSRSNGQGARLHALWIAIVQNADSSSLFDDLDAALQSGSSEKRAAMLRQVTDLFLGKVDRLNEEQIGVFDHVLVQLIKRIEARTLAEISERLAPVAN